MTGSRRRQRRIACIGLAAALAVAAGCGSDSDDEADATTTTAASSGATSTTEAADTGVPADVTAIVEEYLAEPGLSVEPLDAEPEPGIKIAVLFNSSVPSAKSGADHLTLAAEKLGWTTIPIADDGSPEGFLEAFDQAMDADPDVIDVGAGREPETFAEPLARAHEAGIIVIANSILAPPTPIGEGGLQVLVNGPDFTSNVGRIAADWMIADSGGTANIGSFYLEGFPILATTKDAFAAEIARACPGCKVTTTGFKVTDLGTNAPNVVVSTLQANPGIDYLWFDLGDETRGVLAAIEGAGLDVPKMAAGVPIAENYEGLKSGEWSMAVSQSAVLSWYKIHGVARYLETGEPQVVDASTRLITADNIGGAEITIDPDGYVLTPGNYDEAFAEVWHVGS